MSDRSVADLVDLHDDALPMIREWMAAAPIDARLLDCPREAGERALARLQVTTRSPLGALAYHSGGLLIDDGWLRVWGAGSAELPRAVDTWNRLDSGVLRCEHGLVVADDAVGGFFAWFSSPRTVHYFSPDSFSWEDTGRGYTDWLSVMLGDGLALWYEELRWPGWREEVRALEPDRGIHVWPPMVMAGPDLGERSRRPVPVDELWETGMQLATELEGVPDGANVRLVVPGGNVDDG